MRSLSARNGGHTPPRFCDGRHHSRNFASSAFRFAVEMCAYIMVVLMLAWPSASASWISSSGAPFSRSRDANEWRGTWGETGRPTMALTLLYTT